jgi:hypothetical protein
MMLSKINIAACAIAGLGLLAGYATPASAQTGNWNNLANGFPGMGNTGNPPVQVPANTRGPGTALLLTDGSVIMHDICTEHWFRLLPLNTGTFANSYINGQWSATVIGDNASIAQMIGMGTVPDFYGPLFFASVVLPDGRVIVNGGEFENSQLACGTSMMNPPPSQDSTKGSLFDPTANSWTSVPPPLTWATIGDAMGILLGANNITGAFSPASYALQNCCDPTAPQAFEMAVASITGTAVTWTRLSTGKVSGNNEEGWVRLPNGDLLTVNTHPCGPPPPGTPCNPTTAELFVPGVNPPAWRAAGNTPATLVSGNPQSETGPGVSIGFNMVVWFGSVNAIALYQFPTGGPAGGTTWTGQTAWPATPPPATCTVTAAAPTQAVADGPAALLPSGNILVQTSPVGPNAVPAFNAPSCFWEFLSSTLSPTNTGPVAPVPTVNQPACPSPVGTAPVANVTNVASFQGRMLVLPTGQVLWDAGENANCTSVYTSNTTVDPNPVMRPPPHIGTVNGITPGNPIPLTQGSTNNTLTGSMFRGVSQGASYGDDAQSATDFPIVMITNNTSGNRCFGRTHNWAVHVSAQFDIPPAVTPAAGWALVQHPCDTAGGGASTLVVIVNGKQSNSIAVTVN